MKYIKLDKKIKKLEIGSGYQRFDEDDKTMLATDNGSDSWHPEDMSDMDFDIKADGNNLPFEDNRFEEIVSIRCIGFYVTNYKELARVLKPNGKMKMNIWYKMNTESDWNLETEIKKMEKVGFKVTKKEIANYEDDDTPLDYWIELELVE